MIIWICIIITVKEKKSNRYYNFLFSMNNIIKTYIFKIIILSLFFSIVINAISFFVTEWTPTVQWEDRNRVIYKNMDDPKLWNIWVAISTNIWTRYKQLREVPVTIYNEVLDIWYIVSNKTVARDHIISNNLLQINEYYNILQTDILWLLWQSNDRSEVLEAFIDQLEFRYKAAAENIRTLKMQASTLNWSLNLANNKVERIKQNISRNFKNFDSETVIEDIDEYLAEKENYTYARTYIIFVNKFIKYYMFLNGYNKGLLDVVINNKEALIKNSQVVIPDTWANMLRKLKLLYKEDEWKSVSR